MRLYLAALLCLFSGTCLWVFVQFGLSQMLTLISSLYFSLSSHFIGMRFLKTHIYIKNEMLFGHTPPETYRADESMRPHAIIGPLNWLVFISFTGFSIHFEMFFPMPLCKHKTCKWESCWWSNISWPKWLCQQKNESDVQFATHHKRMSKMQLKLSVGMATFDEY